MEQGRQGLKSFQQNRAKINTLMEREKRTLGDEEDFSDEEDGQRRGSDQPRKQRRFELNLNPDYWVKKFLYPFALDPAPLRLDASKQSPAEIIAEKKR